jgi:hypothetical protein
MNKKEMAGASRPKTRGEWFEYFEDNLISADISYRGGTLKINVAELFPGVDDAVIGAYQNYLGGGIAGSISFGSMFGPDDLDTDEEREILEEASEEVKRYFYHLNNGGGDDYMQENVTGPEAGGYEAVQRMPAKYPGL